MTDEQKDESAVAAQRALGYMQWLLLNELVTSAARPTVPELLQTFEDAGAALDPGLAQASLDTLHEVGAIDRDGERVWATPTAIHVMELPDASSK